MLWGSGLWVFISFPYFALQFRRFYQRCMKKAGRIPTRNHPTMIQSVRRSIPSNVQDF